MSTIRLATADDAAALAAIYGPIVEETTISFETAAPGPAEMARRLAAHLAHAPWLVCAPGPDVLGYAYASRHRERAAYQWAVDVSVYVDARHRRRHVGRALYTSLFALLRLQGFYLAHAGIALPNPASVAIHEGLGFRPVGVYAQVGYKRGAWHDVGWWQLVLRAREGEPAPPLPLAEARRRPGWPEAMASGEPLLTA